MRSIEIARSAKVMSGFCKAIKGMHRRCQHSSLTHWREEIGVVEEKSEWVLLPSTGVVDPPLASYLTDSSFKFRLVLFDCRMCAIRSHTHFIAGLSLPELFLETLLRIILPSLIPVLQFRRGCHPRSRTKSSQIGKGCLCSKTMRQLQRRPPVF